MVEPVDGGLPATQFPTLANARNALIAPYRREYGVVSPTPADQARLALIDGRMKALWATATVRR